MRSMSRFLSTALLLSSCVSQPVQSYEIPRSSTPTNFGFQNRTAKALSNELANLSEAAKKALVFISVSKTVKRSEQMIDPFEFFFGPRGGRGPSRDPNPPKQKGLGSGFFIDLRKGYILTNNHVIEGADMINLKLANGKSYTAKVLGRDEHTDVAVVQITKNNFDRSGLASLVLGDSSTLNVGSLVMALGAPFGLEASISVGAISAKGRGSLQITRMGDFLQTDAAINPGNSGGPLVDMDGRVIGINTAIYSRSGGYNGIGFAVPANLVRKVATDLINKGKSVRGYIGIRFDGLPAEWVESFKLPKNTTGIIIREAAKDGPADKAGLEQGDIITHVDNKAITESTSLSTIIGLTRPGKKVRVTYYRNGRRSSVSVTIEPWPGSKDLASNGSARGDDRHNKLGFNARGLDRDLKRRYGIDASEGLVVTSVKPQSTADMAGLREGDLITRANGRRVRSTRELSRMLKQSNGTMIFHIERDGRMYLVPIDKP